MQSIYPGWPQPATIRNNFVFFSSLQFCLFFFLYGFSFLTLVQGCLGDVFDLRISCKLSYRIFRLFPNIPRTAGAAAFINQVKFINPLMFVTGWNPNLIAFCEMHVVHLGICQWVNAGGIILLSNSGYLGPGTFQDHLTVFTSRLNAWCRLTRIRRDSFQHKHVLC